MKRTALVLTASALSLAMSGAFAAGTGEQSGTGMDTQKQSATQLDPSKSYRASDLMDVQVKNAKDEDLGKVSELIVDKEGKVSHVVLQESGTLGMGENKYVVPWDRVSIRSPEEIIIDVSPDALSSEFAAFDEEQYESAMQKEGEKETPPAGGKPSDTGAADTYRQ